MAPVITWRSRRIVQADRRSPSRSIEQGERPGFRAWRALNAPDLLWGGRPSVPRLLRNRYEMAARASAMHRNGRRERLGREKGDYRDQAKSAAGSLK